MATIKSEKELKRLENIEKHVHADILEKRIRRCIAIIDKCHKITLWHRFKQKFIRKCKICKELEGLR